MRRRSVELPSINIPVEAAAMGGKRDGRPKINHWWINATTVKPRQREKEKISLNLFFEKSRVGDVVTTNWSLENERGGMFTLPVCPLSRFRNIDQTNGQWQVKKPPGGETSETSNIPSLPSSEAHREHKQGGGGEYIERRLRGICGSKGDYRRGGGVFTVLFWGGTSLVQWGKREQKTVGNYLGGKRECRSTQSYQIERPPHSSARGRRCDE